MLTIDPIDLIRVMLVGEREPDEIISDTVDGVKLPYLLRWFVKPKSENEGNVYLHCFLRSDFDRAVHDHPWDSTSILLKGVYREHFANGHYEDRKAGDIVTRRAADAHRIELTDGPTWSLFITAPKEREWGFHCPDGWVHWTKFVAAKCGA